jgi:acetoin:2,6-dichlorophenolindophenol oxidoreductase subunit beta
MKSVSTREAINGVLMSELARDRETVYLGETIRDAGATGASAGLFARFGPNQVIETPVSENGIFGAALGLALSGFRPIVEIYSADFALAVANELMNDIPKWRQQHARSGGLPITVRGWMGSTLGLGPEHSQCMESFFHHAPGLCVICPGTPKDMAGLLRAAIRSDEPTIVFEHRRVYELVGEVPDDPDFVVAIGEAEVVRNGRDATVVGWAWMRHLALEAAEMLAVEGVSIEVIDPRTIKRMDFASIVKSVERTGILVVAEEAPATGNIGAEIVARAMEVSARPFKAARVAMPDRVHPYSASMEAELLPSAAAIARAVRVALGRNSADLPSGPAVRHSDSVGAA